MSTDTNLGFFKKSQNAGIPYLHIFDYSICQKSKVELPGWEGPIETAHPQTGATVHTWVMRYDSIAAYIIDTNRFKKEFTKEQGGGRASGMDVTLLAGTMRAVLKLKMQSNGPDPMFKKFLQVAPNLDFEKPVLFSAFRGREGNLAVSIRQGDDPDPQKWIRVEPYWTRELDANGKPDLTTPMKGADGSIVPEPVHDEFADRWDYTAQNSFLLKYYFEKIEPKVKAIAERHNINRAPVVTDEPEDDGFPTHSGGPEPIPVVTTKPDVVVASSVSEAATGEQRAEIRALSTQANFDFEANCPKVMGCSFDELNKEGASFAAYKLRSMIEAQGQPAPPQQPVKEMAVAPAPAPPQLSDDWGTASAPAAVDDTEGIPWLE